MRVESGACTKQLGRQKIAALLVLEVDIRMLVATQAAARMEHSRSAAGADSGGAIDLAIVRGFDVAAVRKCEWVHLCRHM